MFCAWQVSGTWHHYTPCCFGLAPSHGRLCEIKHNVWASMIASINPLSTSIQILVAVENRLVLVLSYFSRCVAWTTVPLPFLNPPWFWLLDDIVHSICLSWTDASWRYFLRTYEDILNRKAVQHHKTKTPLRTLGGASRIYGIHHVNSSPYDSQLILNDYFGELWTSHDIVYQMLNSYCCSLLFVISNISAVHLVSVEFSGTEISTGARLRQTYWRLLLSKFYELPHWSFFVAWLLLCFVFFHVYSLR